MKYVILFLSIFLVVYLIYIIFVVNRKKSLKKITNGKELTYLKYRYKLNYDKINIKSLAHAIALANAFIIAIVVTVISVFRSFWLQMLACIVVLLPTILVIYHIIGKYYQNIQKRRNK